MSRNIITGRIFFGLSLTVACVIAPQVETAAADKIGAGISHRWAPTVTNTANNSWTNLSIDRRGRGSNRSERWFGPTGWRAILSVEYASPFKQDWSAVESGTGAELALVTPSPQGLGLRFSLGWSGIGIDENHHAVGNGWAVPLPPLPPNLRVSDQRQSMDAFRTFLSLQYRTLPPRNVPNAPEFTVFGGVGFITHDMHSEMTISNDSTGQAFWYSADKTSTTPALTLGCAGSVMFTPRVGVEASLSTDILLNEDDEMSTDGANEFDAMHNYDGSWAWRLGLILAF